MKKKTDRGFSLIELIIAIAILIILTGLLAPQFMKYIEKSRKAACLNNIDVVIQEYQVALIENQKVTPEEILDDINPKCPSKGIYSIIHQGEELFVINCSKHGNSDGISTDPAVAAAQKAYNEMKDFVGLSDKEVRDIIGTYSSNTTIREYLLKKHDGSWPNMDEEYLKKIGYSGDLFVQPYIFKGFNDYKGTDDVIVYAGKSTNNSGEPWKAYLIYNHEDGHWYYEPKKNTPYGIQNKPWEVIKKETIENGWVQVN